MENAVKALEMAAGVLLAVIIMAAVVYVISQMAIWPSQEAEMETAEQLSKFNIEYEVYDKKTMYGVDVISCLNKVKNNNEKYADGGAFLSGNKYGREYYINVFVKINSPLEESLDVYYYDVNGRQVQRFSNTATATMGDAGFSIDSNAYTEFSESTPLTSASNTLTDPNKYMIPNPNLSYNNNVSTHVSSADLDDYYRLYDITYQGNGYINTCTSLTGDPLWGLLDFAGVDMRQEKKNSNVSTANEWIIADWKTALYSLKTKRFRCDGIEYSDITGRVCRIYFSEVN